MNRVACLVARLFVLGVSSIALNAFALVSAEEALRLSQAQLMQRYQHTKAVAAKELQDQVAALAATMQAGPKQTTTSKATPHVPMPVAGAQPYAHSAPIIAPPTALVPDSTAATANHPVTPTLPLSPSIAVSPGGAAGAQTTQTNNIYLPAGSSQKATAPINPYR